ALRDGVPTVIDADALAHVTGPVAPPTVLTPHAGELARMLGIDRATIEAQPLAHARDAADHYDAVVLLKGRHTLVAAPGGRVARAIRPCMRVRI
ncbi:MAG: NAD(P)H-hydrate dehydratase, partial [Patescibacteria group bacterium]